MPERYIWWLKRAGAVLLIIAFFLPLSRCDSASLKRYEAEQAGQNPERVAPEWNYYYAWEEFYPERGQPFEPLSALVVTVAFSWPLLFLFGRWKIKNRKVTIGLLFLEPLVAAAGAYSVFIINFLSELYIGFYVAMVAMFLYFAGSVVEIAQWIRKRMKK